MYFHDVYGGDRRRYGGGRRRYGGAGRNSPLRLCLAALINRQQPSSIAIVQEQNLSSKI